MIPTDIILIILQLFFPCVSLSGEAAKKTKQWLAMEVKSTCILRSGKGGAKRHAFSDRPTVRFFNKKIYEGARILSCRS